MAEKGLIKIEATSSNSAYISMKGDVSDWDALMFEAQVNALIEQGVTEASVFLETDGGDVFAAYKIGATIRRFPGKVHGTLGVMCASSGTYISSHFDTVKMPSNGVFMFHKPMLFAQGNIDEVSSQMKLLADITKEFLKVYTQVTGKSEAEIEALWKNDCYLTAKEAKEMGFVSEIIEEVPLTPKIAASLHRDRLPEKFTQIKAYKIEEPKNNNNYSMKKVAIMAVLGSVPQIVALSENASETEVLAAIKAAMDGKDVIINDLKRKIQQINTEKVTVIVDAAIKDGRITESEKPHWTAMIEANYEASSAILNNMTPRVDINQTINNGKNTPEAGAPLAVRADWDYAKWMKEDPTALNAMRTSSDKAEKERFEALLNKHIGLK